MDSIKTLESKLAAFVDRHDLGGLGQDVGELITAVVAVAHDLDAAVASLSKPVPPVAPPAAPPAPPAAPPSA